MEEPQQQQQQQPAQPELVEEMTQAVVDSLDLDNRLRALLKPAVQSGSEALRELRADQRSAAASLQESMNECLAGQQSLSAENAKLLGVLQDLQQVLIDRTAGEWSPWARPHVPAPVRPDPPVVEIGTFVITLRTASAGGLGLNLTVHDDYLEVDSIVPGTVMEAWNRQCTGQAGRAVVPGDRLIGVNSIVADPKAMLEELAKNRLLKLTLSRNPAAVKASPTPPSTSSLRGNAPEFIPSSKRNPLSEKQPTANEPSLTVKESSGKIKSRSAPGPVHRDNMAMKEN
mmetsp:Transcript_22519/g.49750  ORF Transcript_22519/g.49750 Transcript_22519/m.49750 type:complete len:286 (-) Transcript_22519:83-940(-)